ncbi:MAG: tetratricopeptide repeat protein [Anaerolineae bacterium]
MVNDAGRYQVRFREMVATNAAHWLGRLREGDAELEALRAERANLIKAVDRALAEPGAQEVGIHLAIEMYTLAELQGWWVEWLAYLDMALPMAPAQSVDAANLLQQNAELHYLAGDQTMAQERAESALVLWLDMENAQGIAYASSVLSLVYARQGRFELAVQVSEQAVQALESGADPHSVYWGESRHALLARVHNNWGIVCLESLDMAGALAHFEVAEFHWRQIGHQWKLARLWHNRGVAYHRLGQMAEAETALRQAIAGHEANHDRARCALARSALATVAHAQGDSQQALTLAAQAEPDLAAVGDRVNLAHLSNNRSEYYKALGRFADAEVASLDAINRLRALGQQPKNESISLVNLGELYRLWGREAAAEKAFAEARARFAAILNPPPDLVQWFNALLAQASRVEPLPATNGTN